MTPPPAQSYWSSTPGGWPPAERLHVRYFVSSGGKVCPECRRAWPDPRTAVGEGSVATRRQDDLPRAVRLSGCRVAGQFVSSAGKVRPPAAVRRRLAAADRPDPARHEQALRRGHPTRARPRGHRYRRPLSAQRRRRGPASDAVSTGTQWRWPLSGAAYVCTLER